MGTSSSALTPLSARTSGIGTPAATAPPATSVPATWNAALTMLFAATAPARLAAPLAVARMA